MTVGVIGVSHEVQEAFSDGGWLMFSSSSSLNMWMVSVLLETKSKLESGLNTKVPIETHRLTPLLNSKSF